MEIVSFPECTAISVLYAGVRSSLTSDYNVFIFEPVVVNSEVFTVHRAFTR